MGSGNRKSSATDGIQSDWRHDQTVSSGRTQSSSTRDINSRGERPQIPWCVAVKDSVCQRYCHKRVHWVYAMQYVFLGRIASSHRCDQLHALVARSVICLSACWAYRRACKTAEPIDIPFGRWGRAHIGATWPIRLNDSCTAAMRPCVKLLRPPVCHFVGLQISNERL